MKYKGPRFNDAGEPIVQGENPVGGTYRPGVHTAANGTQSAVLVREQTAGHGWAACYSIERGHHDVRRSEVVYQ